MSILDVCKGPYYHKADHDANLPEPQKATEIKIADYGLSSEEVYTIASGGSSVIIGTANMSYKCLQCYDTTLNPKLTDIMFQVTSVSFRLKSIPADKTFYAISINHLPNYSSVQFPIVFTADDGTTATLTKDRNSFKVVLSDNIDTDKLVFFDNKN